VLVSTDAPPTRTPRSPSIRLVRPAPATSTASLALALLGASVAAAHSPHDVVRMIELSPSFASDRTIVTSLLISENDYVGISTDGGRRWTHLGTPLAHKMIRRFAFSPDYSSDGTLFAAALNSGVWRSTDGGWTWSGPLPGPPSVDVHDVAVSPGFAADGVVLAATDAGLARSTNGGDAWSVVALGSPGEAVTFVRFAAGAPATAFAGNETVYRSLDGGQTWSTLAGFGTAPVRLTVSPGYPADSTLAVCFGADALEPGVRVSTDGGTTFSDMSSGLTDTRVNDVAIADDGTFFAVSDSVACFRADAALGSWSVFDEGFEVLAAQTESHYDAVAASPAFSSDGHVFVSGWEGFFTATDRGETWIQSEVYHQLVSRVLGISPDYPQDGQVYAGNYGGGPYVWDELQKRWSTRGFGLPYLFSAALAVSPTFAVDRTLLYGRNGLWKSTDAGANWTAVTPTGNSVVRGVEMSPSFATDGVAFMNRPGDGGTFRTTDAGATWTLHPALVNGEEAIAFSPAFALDGTVFAGVKEAAAGVLRSTDGGDSWVNVSGAIGSITITELAPAPSFASDGVIFAGTRRRGLFLSTDRGDSWVLLDGVPSGNRDLIESVAVSPDWTNDRTVYAVSLYDGVLRSTDGGATWETRNQGLPPDAKRKIVISPAFASDGTLYLTTHAWTYRSTDGGLSWWALPGYVRVNDRHQAVRHGGSWAVHYHSQDYGTETTASDVAGAWEELEFFGGNIAWIARCDDESGLADVFLDGKLEETVDLYSAQNEHRHRVFSRSLENGWHAIRIEVTGKGGAASSGSWVRSDGFEYLSVLADGSVHAGPGALSAAGALDQNRPNPFRPSTTIRFSLAARGPARLVVYDVRGAAVRVLVDAVREGGSHRVEWDGRDDAGRRVAAGAYFYELQAGSVRESRKMILVR